MKVYAFCAAQGRALFRQEVGDVLRSVASVEALAKSGTLTHRVRRPNFQGFPSPEGQNLYQT